MSGYCTIESSSKESTILTFLLAFWLSLHQYNQHRFVKPQVAGVETQQDPNHPVEVYFGRTGLYDLKSMLDELKVKTWPEDKVQTIPPPELGLGSRIVVTRATPVNITDAKIETKYRTWAKTLGDLLKEQHIELLAQDSIEPESSTEINWNMTAKITRVAELDLTQKEEIDFKVTKKEDINLEKGQSRVETAGVKGEKEVVYHIKRVDGVEVSRKITSTTVLKEPQTQVLIVGIGPKYVKSGPYVDLLNAAARKYLINATALQCLMLRESGGSADAGYPDAYYKGLFQYEEGYWADASSIAGYAGASIYNAEAQIYATAYALTHGQSRRWPPYKYCADK